MIPRRSEGPTVPMFNREGKAEGERPMKWSEVITNDVVHKQYSDGVGLLTWYAKCICGADWSWDRRKEHIREYRAKRDLAFGHKCDLQKATS